MLVAISAVVLGSALVIAGIAVGKRRGWGWGMFIIACGAALALGPKGLLGVLSTPEHSGADGTTPPK